MKEIEKHSIETVRTAYYFSYGNTQNAEHLWIVFHGYGQQADEFLSPFQDLDKSKHGVIAPEGLSRFYVKNDWEKVVSSWMTKRFRESEIMDQLHYLDKIYQNYRTKAKHIHVLGFSQGVATAVRWLYYKQPRVNSMILWAGWPPEDVNYAEKSDYWKTINNTYVYGNQDIYVTEERIKAFNDRSDLKDLNFKTIEFDGGHHLSRSVIDKLSSEFIDL